MHRDDIGILTAFSRCGVLEVGMRKRHIVQLGPISEPLGMSDVVGIGILTFEYDIRIGCGE